MKKTRWDKKEKDQVGPDQRKERTKWDWNMQTTWWDLVCKTK